MSKPNGLQDPAECFNCGDAVERDDHFCHGCKNVVCETCSVGWPCGTHEPSAHLEESEYEEEWGV